ncbi:hypothetical protein ACR0ST_04315 [Aliidiomarina sp. Khilg15.8]
MRIFYGILICLLGLITIAPVVYYLFNSVGQPPGSLSDLSNYGAFIGGTLGTLVIAITALIVYKNLIYFKSSNNLLQSSISLQKDLIDQERDLITLKAIATKYESKASPSDTSTFLNTELSTNGATQSIHKKTLSKIASCGEGSMEKPSTTNLMEGAFYHDKATLNEVLKALKTLSEDAIMFASCGGTLRNLKLPSVQVHLVLKAFHENEQNFVFFEEASFTHQIMKNFSNYYVRLDSLLKTERYKLDRTFGIK